MYLFAESTRCSYQVYNLLLRNKNKNITCRILPFDVIVLYFPVCMQLLHSQHAIHHLLLVPCIYCLKGEVFDLEVEVGNGPARLTFMHRSYQLFLLVAFSFSFVARKYGLTRFSETSPSIQRVKQLYVLLVSCHISDLVMFESGGREKGGYSLALDAISEDMGERVRFLLLCLPFFCSLSPAGSIYSVSHMIQLLPCSIHSLRAR